MFVNGLRIGGVIGFSLLLSNGTFIKTKYFKIALVIFAIVIIGVLLKILHWIPYANYIITLGISGVVITYFLSFLKKQTKKQLDYLKLIWVIVGFTISILGFSHFLKGEYEGLGIYILWVLIIDFVVTELISRKNFLEKQ